MVPMLVNGPRKSELSEHLSRDSLHHTKQIQTKHFLPIWIIDSHFASESYSSAGQYYNLATCGIEHWI